MQSCDAAFGLMQTYDGRLVRTVATRGVTAEYATHLAVPRPIAPGTNHDRLVRGEPFVHIEDVRDTELYRSGQPQRRASADLGGQRTLVCVALRKADKCLGFFFIFRQEVRPFTDKQIALLQTFAQQAVIAMENARLLGELQARTHELEESLEYQTATSDVLNVISRSTADVQPVLDTVAETGQRLCDSDLAALSIREGDVFRFVATRSLDPAWDAILRARTFAPGRETLAGRVALTGEIVHIPDITTDPDYRLPGAATIGKIRTQLGVPLLREGSVIGTLNLARERVEPFTERQIDLVRTFADQAVIAIENARLLSELQQRTGELAVRDSEFGERIEHQSATIDVLKAMSASPGDPQPVFDLIVRRARELCNTNTASLFEFDGELVHLRSVVRRGAYYTPDAVEAYQRLFPMVPTRGSITCRAILDRQTIHVRDMATVPGVSAAVRNLGYKSQIALPLLRDGAAIGVVGLANGETGGFTDSQVALLQTFAEQAVIAITSAETYRELQARTRDLERIARIPDRDQRRLEGHQPLDRRCATGSGHSGRNGRPALRRRYRRDLHTRGRGLPPRGEFVQCSGARVLGDGAPANPYPRSQQYDRAGGARRQGRAYHGHPR
jgi:GAF domain-containing protein